MKYKEHDCKKVKDIINITTLPRRDDISKLQKILRINKYPSLIT